MSRPQVTLIQGDCLEVLPSLDKGKVAVVTDPPYGIDWDTDYTRFTSGFKVAWKNHKPVANDAEPFDPSPWLQFKRVLLFGANCFSDRLPCGSWLIWDKRFDNGSAFLADGEAAWMNKGHGVYIRSVTQQGCIRPEKREHPTQKPIAIMDWCFRKLGLQPGDTIIDPYMGSGTTIVAAIRAGINAIGVEIDPAYFAIAQKRIADEQARTVLFDRVEERAEQKLLAI